MPTLWLPRGQKPAAGQRVAWDAYTPAIARPALYLPFNEGCGALVNDASGNGNHGTLTNGPLWVPTQRGLALDLDGADDFVACGTGLSITDRITISALVYPTLLNKSDLNTWHDIITKWDGTNPTNYGLRIGTDYLIHDGNAITFYYRVGADGWHIWDTYNNDTGLVINKWQRITVSFIYGVPSSLGVYIDGASKTSLGTWKLGDGTGVPVASTQPVTIGIYSGFGSTQKPHFKGSMSDLEVFNSALTAKQVEALQGPVPIWVPQRYWSVAAGGIITPRWFNAGQNAGINPGVN